MATGTLAGGRSDAVSASTLAAVLVAVCTAGAVAGCGQAQTASVGSRPQVDTEEAAIFDNERMPPIPPPDPALPRRVRGLPWIAVVGRGAFADGLADGRAYARLPEGWRAEVSVPSGCRSEDCLHWSAWSAAGTQRIERLPRLAPSGAGAAVRTVAKGGWERASRRIDEIRTRMFPGAGEAKTRMLRDARLVPSACGPGRGSEDSFAIQEFMHDIGGRQREVHLMIEVAGDPDQDEAATDACTPGDNARGSDSAGVVEGMPQSRNVLVDMREIARSFTLLPEGWDASRAQCQFRISGLCTQQSLQSARDCANASCVQVAGFWQLRIGDEGDIRHRLQRGR